MSLSFRTLSAPFKLNFVFVFILALALNACGPEEQQGPKGPGVTVMTLEPQNIPLTGEFVGQTAGYREVEVRAQVSGILLNRTYTEGEFVQQNDLLFQIDPAPYEAALNQARGNLSQAQARFHQAKLDNDRFIQLYKEEAVSRKERDDAVASFRAAKGDLDSALAMVKEAEINLGYTAVLAPISGATSEESVSEGNLINVGQMLTKVIQRDPLYVNFSIPSTDALRYRDMQNRGFLEPPADNKFTITIKLTDGSIHSGHGELDFIDPMVDPVTSSIKARGQMENTDGKILPGQFARVYMKGYMFKNVLAVPQRAVLSTQKGPMIYILDEKNVATPSMITYEMAIGSDYILSTGAKPGDRIVVEGIQKVKPGGEVHIIAPKSNSTSEGPSK